MASGLSQGVERLAPRRLLFWKYRHLRSCSTVLVACLAHARRYFIKALLNDKAGCNQALLMFQSLYEIERTAKELEIPCDELKVMREQESVPILETFHKWLQEKYAIAQLKALSAKRCSTV